MTLLLVLSVILSCGVSVLVLASKLRSTLQRKYRDEKAEKAKQLPEAAPSREECELLAHKPGNEHLLLNLGEEMQRLSDLRHVDLYRGGAGWALAKVLLHVARFAIKDGGSDGVRTKAENSYWILRRLLSIRAFETSYRPIGLVFFLWLAVGSFQALGWLGFKARLFADLANSLLHIACLGTLATLILYLGGYWLRILIQRTRNEKDDIVMGASLGPLTAIAWLKGLFETVADLGAIPEVRETIAWSNAFLFGSWWRSAITIAVATWVGTMVFNKVLIFALRRYVRRTEQKYDDMFVALLQLFGSFIILAIGTGVLLLAMRSVFDVDNFSVDVMLPYSLAVSVLSAVLGYASKDALENFLGGTLLQIDNPFKIGERLVLGTGEICDVREVGMRSTKLYNITENTELYIPNSLLANQVITNISRPDSELRIQVNVFIPVVAGGECPLRRAELLLMDIAYLDTEVENARISADDFGETEDTTRKSIREEFARLERLRGDVLLPVKAKMARARLGRRVRVNRSLDIDEILGKIDSERTKYQEAFDDWPGRREHLAKIVSRFQELEEAVATVTERAPELKEDLVRLISELAKEPDVHSTFEVCEDGCVYLKVTLGIFTTHLERRLEVTHKLHQEIVERFLAAGIPVRQICCKGEEVEREGLTAPAR